MNLSRLFLCGFLSAAGLAGCASPVSQMLDNKFTETMPVPPPEGWVGIWSGNAAYYLVTYIIKADGTGYYCLSAGSQAAQGLVKIKVMDEENIIVQTGFTMEVTLDEEGDLTTETSAYGRILSVFNADFS